MPLTPAEVHNVVFKKPPIGKRGYDEEEVDAFLDIIEVELARLIEENKDLRDRTGDGFSGPVAVPSDADRSAADPDQDRRVSELEAALAQARQELATARQELEAAQREVDEHKQLASSGKGDSAAMVTARDENKRLTARVTELEGALNRARQVSTGGGGVSQLSQAERVLALAQQAADEQTAAAQAHHDQVIADAKAHQDRVEGEAKAYHDKTISEAQALAEQLDRESRAKAAARIQDAEQLAHQVTGQLEQRKADLESRLEELRTFEHEYRSRLKSYLESQLHDLESSSRVEPDQMQLDRGEQGATTG